MTTQFERPSEIETYFPTPHTRRYLVDRAKMPERLAHVASEQGKIGFLLGVDRQAVMRLYGVGDDYSVTIKGATTSISRSNFDELWKSDVLARVEKTRHYVTIGPDRDLMVDIYIGDHMGLVTADIEPEIAIAGSLPEWMAMDVTEVGNYADSGITLGMANEFITKIVANIDTSGIVRSNVSDALGLQS